MSLKGRWDGFGGSEPQKHLLPSLTGFVSCVQYAQLQTDLSRSQRIYRFADRRFGAARIFRRGESVESPLGFTLSVDDVLGKPED